MGILSHTLDDDLPITHKNLTDLGFYKSGWGKPDGRNKNGKVFWNKEHHFYQYTERLEPGKPRFAVMWYFPKNFEGYCTAFNWHGKNPAGGLYITIDAYDCRISSWNDTMPVESMDAIKCALAIIKNKYNESKKR